MSLTTSRCVGVTLADRCTAIREYVQADDLRPWGHRVPAARGETPADSVAAWMRYQFTTRTLSYIADPDHCDLWGRPSATFFRGGGDCDDLSIVVAAALDVIDVPWVIVVGLWRGGGHAWVEGTDTAGGFLIETTAIRGNIYRGRRPVDYNRQQLLSRNCCSEAPEYVKSKKQAVQASRQVYAQRGLPWLPPNAQSHGYEPLFPWQPRY